MSAITYDNTATNHALFDANFHKEWPFGFAYETATHFVHFYGKVDQFNYIMTRHTLTEIKTGTLEDWIKKLFGATNIANLQLPEGNVVDSVWRPGLYYFTDCDQALSITESEKRNAEQAIMLLIERLEEIFLYIHPDTDGLKSYGHKTRELLILACTEVENFWQYYLRKAGLTVSRPSTRDYIKLLTKLHLKEYQFTLDAYPAIPPLCPFSTWTTGNPTKSLSWYNAYNETKHDRDTNFHKSTLLACIEAVAANLVMYSIRFSPHQLTEQSNRFSALYNQHFKGTLINSDRSAFYLHSVSLPATFQSTLTTHDPRYKRHVAPFIINPLVL